MEIKLVKSRKVGRRIQSGLESRDQYLDVLLIKALIGDHSRLQALFFGR